MVSIKLLDILLLTIPFGVLIIAIIHVWRDTKYDERMNKARKIGARHLDEVRYVGKTIELYRRPPR